MKLFNNQTFFSFVLVFLFDRKKERGEGREMDSKFGLCMCTIEMGEIVYYR